MALRTVSGAGGAAAATGSAPRAAYGGFFTKKPSFDHAKLFGSVLAPRSRIELREAAGEDDLAVRPRSDREPIDAGRSSP